MSNIPRLSETQKKELRILEPALRNCVRTGDFETSKKLTTKIQKLLRSTGHETRLLQAKNWFYECAMESGNIEFAISGFVGTRKKMSANTRTYLESTALLSICYLRKPDFDEAKILIHETISKINNIKSDSRRRQFHKRFLKRIEEESILAGLIGYTQKQLDVNIVQEKAIELIQSKSDIELFEILKRALPSKSIRLLEEFRNYSVHRISPPDRILLPPPEKALNDIEVGRTATSALKRVAWRSICDPNSEVYKA